MRSDERIDEGILQWLGLVERMERDRITNRVYVKECAGSCSVGRPWKRWIDTMKDCLREIILDVRQARRMVQDRCKWWSFEGECMGHSPGDVPLTLTRCHSCGLPHLYEALEGWRFVCGLAYSLKAYRRKFIFYFLS